MKKYIRAGYVKHSRWEIDKLPEHVKFAGVSYDHYKGLVYVPSRLSDPCKLVSIEYDGTPYPIGTGDILDDAGQIDGSAVYDVISDGGFNPRYLLNPNKEMGITSAENVNSETQAQYPIQVGMTWYVEGHWFECTEVSGRTATLEASWIAEDSGKSCSAVSKYPIKVSDTGSEYLDTDVSWLKYYATSALNADKFFPELFDNSTDEDDYEDTFYDEYYDEYYNEAEYERDYGPSNPWDAPGMSIRDFIR